MRIHRSGSRPSAKGPANYFTGAVRVDAIVEAPEPARVRALTITFEPSARTHWHTHPLGQALLVESGLGLAQVWGESAQLLRPGDSVWFEPGEKHWHGAHADVAMSHIAIQEAAGGKAVEWLEPVTDDQYQAAIAQTHRE